MKEAPQASPGEILHYAFSFCAVSILLSPVQKENASCGLHTKPFLSRYIILGLWWLVSDDTSSNICVSLEAAITQMLLLVSAIAQQKNKNNLNVHKGLCVKVTVRRLHGGILLI